ncbi:hypothetical protein K8O68_10480 [Salipaludibacillus sp. CUR1]|uniref:hypothetical protein n=1 Tax=Salipaludibacillus sp. CUR1 TaxID=2820003 RepID=UPI001E3F3F4B|nr:hypothetical protein [Salipaludibacillus sp. CUR1]MCE7792841.1 hypothetical protein [Salipaludibacillus sp. CUR1]
MGLRPLKCECSGLANFLSETDSLTANICPDCKLNGSAFNFSWQTSGHSFNATKINRPECFEIGSRKYLQVCGRGDGTIPIDVNVITFENWMFTLQLIENENGEPFLITWVNGSLESEEGISSAFFGWELRPNDLSITPCNPLPTFTSATVPAAQKSITKNTKITFINGKLDKKES